MAVCRRRGREIIDRIFRLPRPARLRFGRQGTRSRRRRGGRAVELHPPDAKPDAATLRRHFARNRQPIYRHGRRHAPQSRNHANPLRQKIADPVFHTRRLRHPHGQPPLSTLAAPPLTQPRPYPRPPRSRCRAGFAIRNPARPSEKHRRHRTHRRPHRRRQRPSARPRRPARQPVCPIRNRIVRRGQQSLRNPQSRFPRNPARRRNPQSRRNARTRRLAQRRRRHQPRLLRRTRRVAPHPKTRRRIPARPRSARTRTHRPFHPQSRVQPRPRLLHRAIQSPGRTSPRRLPTPPDPEKRRTLHHSRTQNLRRQSPDRARAGIGIGKTPV